MSSAPTCSAHPAPTENIGAQLAKFRPVRMPFATRGLSAREVKMVRKLVEAGQYLESIYWRQSDPEGLTLYNALAGCPRPLEKQIHHFLLINGSRYDLLEGNKPFLANASYSPGRALYPQGVTRKEIDDYVAAGAAVPDALVDEVALVGSRERIAEPLEAWRACGVTTLLCQTRDVETLRLMAEIAT